MKPTILTLSLLLFALITYLPSAFTQVTNQVLDTNGNPIFQASRFYIKPALFGAAGGGVRLGETGTSTCPLTVLQDYSEVVTGLSVRFSIPNSAIDMIYVDKTPLDIVFEEKPKCVESSKWVVVQDDFPTPWVAIGGSEDHKGKQVINGKFRIVKHGFGYKIVFCPRFTAPPGLCHDIGRYNDENGRRLVLTENDPFEVVFEDARAIRSIV